MSKIWYYSNVLHTPEWVIKELNGLISKFILWSNRRHIISRNMTFMPFHEGGLNIVNISNKIKAQQVVWVSKMLTCTHKCSVLFN